MIGNWRRCFELTRGRYPEARYFAWASDHDLWHPRLLAALVGQLEDHPEAVLAYSSHLKISETGEPRGEVGWRFDTTGITSRNKRFIETTWRMSAGNMIYGLFRSDALLKAGVFRRILLPDRFLIAEISLQGEFRQVPELLLVPATRRSLQPRAAAPLPIWTEATVVGTRSVVDKPAEGARLESGSFEEPDDPTSAGLPGFSTPSSISSYRRFCTSCASVRRFQKRHLPRYIVRARELFSRRPPAAAAGG